MNATTPKYPPRMPANERREQILDVTLHLIAHQGFEALTIDAVAKAAEITRPVVYGFFSDQEELLNALLDREEQRVLGQVMSAIPSIAANSDPVQVLVRAIESFLSVVQETPDTWRLILLPSEGLPREIRHRINGRREEVIAQLDGLVSWGMQRLGGPDDVESNLLARMIVGFAQDAARLALNDPETFSIERMSKFAASLVGAMRTGDPGEPGEPPPINF